MRKQLQLVDLFSGVGGFTIAADQTNIPTICFVEKDKNCQKVLKQNWPHIPILTRIETVTGDTLHDLGAQPDNTIFGGGFPCQDVSIAGKQAGLAGQRTGLFSHVMRLVNEFQPAHLLFENVPGLLTSNNGRDMETITNALGNSGYEWTYRILDSQNFGIPQRRRRLFITGHRRNINCTIRSVLALNESSIRDSATWHPKRTNVTGVAR
jgi:DNA (cytosine-5)-methyltransferase 1